MKRMLTLLLLPVFFATILTGCQAKKSLPAHSPSDKNSPVLATYGDRSITAEEFVERSKELSPEMRGSVGEHRREFLDQIIDQYFLEKEARRRGIDRLPEVKEIVSKAEGQIIVGKLMESEMEKNATLGPDEAQKYYDAHKSEFMQPFEFRFSQMTFATAEEADAAKKELDGGANFADVANRAWKDATTAPAGGDVGYFKKGMLVPVFEENVLSLKVGETGSVLKTEYGYHILKLTELKEPAPKEFKDVQKSIENRLSMEKQKKFYEEFMRKVRGGAKVTVDEKRLADVPFKKEKQGFPMGGGMISAGGQGQDDRS